MLLNTSKLSFGNVSQDALKQEHTPFDAFCPGVTSVSIAPAFIMQTEAACHVAGDTVCLLQQPIMVRTIIQ